MALRTARSFEIDPCSAPAGSNERYAIEYGMTQWNRIAGMSDRFYFQTAAYCGITTFLDAHWMLGFVPPDDPMLDGNLATTRVQSAPCASPYDSANDGHAQEIDAVVSTETVFVPWGYELTTGQRDPYSTWTHELGHVLGLKHARETWEASIMIAHDVPRVGARGASGEYGGRVSPPMPDDVVFATNTAYHGDGATGYPDPTVSPWYLIGNSFWGVEAHPFDFSSDNATTSCPGEVLSVDISFANLGKRDFSNWVGFRLVMSPNAAIDASDTWVGGGWYWANPGGFFSVEWGITVPNLPPGSYIVGLIADPDNLVTDEEYELNNAMLTGRIVTIRSGC
jgi:hypothetical protein